VFYGTTLAVIAASFILSRMGLKFVSTACALMTVFVLSTFTMLVAFSIPKIHSRPVHFVQDVQKVRWRNFLNVLLFNCVGFDSVGSIVKEVENPRTTIPRAVAINILLIGLFYEIAFIIPYFAVSSPDTDWTNGYYAVVASTVAGTWLRNMVIVAALVSNFQLFVSNVQCSIYTLEGMSATGLLPASFGTRNAHGTPADALVLTLVVCVVFGFVPYYLSLSIQTVLFVFVYVIQLLVYSVWRESSSKAESIILPKGWFTTLVFATVPLFLLLLVIGTQNALVTSATIFAQLMCGVLWLVSRRRHSERGETFKVTHHHHVSTSRKQLFVIP
jgi:hypothetical protein